MEHKVVWENAIRKAIEGGFDLEDWNKRYFPENHSKLEKMVLEAKCAYIEAFLLTLTPMKMKAMAFSHDFAQGFFPKDLCAEAECSVCKEYGGHANHTGHMKKMCDYCDFTFYLEIILDGGS